MKTAAVEKQRCGAFGNPRIRERTRRVFPVPFSPRKEGIRKKKWLMKRIDTIIPEQRQCWWDLNSPWVDLQFNVNTDTLVFIMQRYIIPMKRQEIENSYRDGSRGESSCWANVTEAFKPRSRCKKPDAAVHTCNLSCEEMGGGSRGNPQMLAGQTLSTAQNNHRTSKTLSQGR